MTGLDVFALLVLFVLLAGTVAALVALGMMPGRIACARGHPQADAIAVCGWCGLITLGILLPLAYIWAYTRPAGAPASPATAATSRDSEATPE